MIFRFPKNLIGISTHALREEGDVPWEATAKPLAISTHALREEGDGLHPAAGRAVREFLPTPSARRATARPPAPWSGGFISTHALREEGDGVGQGLRARHIPISTHALREEGDRPLPAGVARISDFYPRPPRGGRRGRRLRCTQPRPISTHALREEGDLDQVQKPRLQTDFYPRPPRGGRPA